MEQIALIAGDSVIYWRSLLVTAGVITAILFFLAFYLRKPGTSLSAAIAIPMAILLSLCFSRFLHWYCRSDSYVSASAAMTNYSVGSFALLGAFVGCALTALILRILRVSRSLPHMLDCMSLAGAAGIAVGRLASFFGSSDRGPIVQTLRGLPWVYPITNQISGEMEYRFATFLIQSIATGVIFLVLTMYYLSSRKKIKLPEGDTCILFLMLYGASQVVLDSTRYDSLYFRSNGFVSIVQVMGALAIGLAVVYFSVRMVRKTGMRPWYFGIWIVIAGLMGLAGYMEYHVQRHGNEAVFAYSVMSICLILIIFIVLVIRTRANKPKSNTVFGGRNQDPTILGNTNDSRGKAVIVPKTKKRTGSHPFRFVMLFCILVAVSAGVFLKNHYWTGWQFVSRDSTHLDATGRQLTSSDYRRIQDALPECEIVWDVPFQGTVYPSDTRMIQVSSLSEQDVAALSYFPNLEVLDATDCMDYDQLLSFREKRPECNMLFQVRVGTSVYKNDATQLILRDASADDLSQSLPLLTDVTEVKLIGNLPSGDQLRQLQEEFPAIHFCWEISLGGTTIDSSATELDLSEKSLRYDEVDRALSLLPELKRADMRLCGLTDAEMIHLSQRYPDCFFLWDMEVAGLRFPTDSSEIDISGQPVEDRGQIEAFLPCFPNLERVVMCQCGLDDETMDALNQSYEDIRFIWSVKIKNVYLRTDATYFYPFKFYRDMVVNNADIYPLRYCTDMIGIDIGHMSDVTDCEWAAYMPNLKYLVIVETSITDLSPLSNLKNLVFLEIFTTKITDYSPLLGCTALEDLNLGWTYGDPTPIAKMTWLKNLWWSGVDGTIGLPCSNAKAILTEALPNTRMKFNLQTPNVNNGWRQLDNYYAMRDLMEVFYLQ